MANWTNEASQSGFDAKTFTTNTMSNRDVTREGANVSGGGFLSGFFGGGNSYSVVGINATQVDIMRGAIRDYVSRIQGHLNQIRADATANNAYKSEEVQQAVETYVQKVKDYCMNLASQLLAFSDKLADVRKAWEAATANMASQVGSASGSFDAGTRYQDDQ